SDVYKRQATGLPVFGTIPYTPNLSVPERHLGLIPTAEPGRWQAFIDAAADAVEAALDLDALLTAARSAPPLPAAAEAPVFTAPTERTVVAVARDEAFSFLYADNLDLLRDAGADLAFFSPLHDSAVPENAQALILSGGFPEIYAEQLAANTAMRQAIRAFAANGGRIYAECGGLMALTEALVDADGVSHPMVGVLPGRAVMTGSLTIGYRRAVPAAGSWLLAPGEEVRGHEFHHSRWEGRPPELPAAYHLLTPEGDRIPAGAVIGSVIASYVHLHFWSLPTIAARIVSG
ncbi:MAG: cobyrinate a,c-diamide synthase, partial [Chloroflexi bacterium]|nr:cobyrinate a,c-diamide synthase [Chloroflexota bacterium]